MRTNLSYLKILQLINKRWIWKGDKEIMIYLKSRIIPCLYITILIYVTWGLTSEQLLLQFISESLYVKTLSLAIWTHVERSLPMICILINYEETKFNTVNLERRVVLLCTEIIFRDLWSKTAILLYFYNKN